TVANYFRHRFASYTVREDNEVNEDWQDFKNLFDRLRSFFKVPEDITFECFVETDKDLSATAKASESEIFEMFKPFFCTRTGCVKS
ncbi:hypothetical protein HZS_3007, partial [Henneguya salminicola]